VFAIGEVALHAGRTYGLVAPGYEMADVLAKRLAGEDAAFKGADQSAKLKMLGTDVASFGDPFGDPAASILIVGLAPAANGGNRTGRVFTGDASGDFLWPVLHAVGLASRPTSVRTGDGLTLSGARIAAVVRCAPPDNKPTPDEMATCQPYLLRELELLDRLRIIVALGAIAWDSTLRVLAATGVAVARPRPRFGHGAETSVGPYVLLGTYHPSQQNTNTGRLTAPMLEAVLRRAVILGAAARDDAGD